MAYKVAAVGLLIDLYLQAGVIVAEMALKASKLQPLMMESTPSDTRSFKQRKTLGKCASRPSALKRFPYFVRFSNAVEVVRSKCM